MSWLSVSFELARRARGGGVRRAARLRAPSPWRSRTLRPAPAGGAVARGRRRTARRVAAQRGARAPCRGCRRRRAGRSRRARGGHRRAQPQGGDRGRRGLGARDAGPVPPAAHLAAAVDRAELARTPPDPRAINVVLDPGVAFGTGHHATTRMCLRWLERVDRAGARRCSITAAARACSRSPR